MGLLLVLQTLGLSGVTGGLLAGAGLSAVVIGFAFKNIAENFLAGLILAFNRPFEINDSIKVEEVLGKVKGLLGLFNQHNVPFKWYAPTLSGLSGTT